MADPDLRAEWCGQVYTYGSRSFQDRLATFLGGPARLINPDEYAKVYYASNPTRSLTDANLWAATEVPRDVRRSIDVRENVVVETVLSSNKYEPIIEYAHNVGYQVGMIYLALEAASISTARVKKRVAAGGHDVPEDRLAPRWRRSLDNLVRFAPLLDGLLVYLSTSRNGLILLAQKYDGKVYWYGGNRFPALHLRLGAQKPPRSAPRTGGLPL